MKKKQKQTIMQKSPKELTDLIAKKGVEIAHAQLKRSDEKNTNLIKTLKKELAIMLTAKREKQLVQELQIEEK